MTKLNGDASVAIVAKTIRTGRRTDTDYRYGLRSLGGQTTLRHLCTHVTRTCSTYRYIHTHILTHTYTRIDWSRSNHNSLPGVTGDLCMLIQGIVLHLVLHLYLGSSCGYDRKCRWIIWKWLCNTREYMSYNANIQCVVFDGDHCTLCIWRILYAVHCMTHILWRTKYVVLCTLFTCWTESRGHL